MDPEKPDHKQEGKNPKSSNPSLDLDIAEKDHSFDKSKSNDDLISSPNTSAPMSTSSSTPSPNSAQESKPDGYDPNRLPESIFSTDPNRASEWSIASTESLFSIHSSFSGNKSFLKKDKPDDSKKKDSAETIDNQELVHSIEPPVSEITTPSATIPPTSASNARQSVESETSTSSFSFPVLVNDCGKNGLIDWAPGKPEPMHKQVPDHAEAPKASKRRRLCCFPCWRCCYCCC
ncbi:uncharacterized protein LOC127241973 [Andrographis paniculata]|uniref:uncharacterized protein LOC127241973 n=1 Tax=Andrographis paniculata TaxID=175694 RepID=UPI0021E7D3E9|nr:uncharacterized protein LOC127241973 [Andrographis paniculata]XP_051117247.1 uncharacterized protein LOC127241973 [Andrographis paniculata]XP_051117256.1 uncharacterized protein LOC127241973 [Andrographis paniculata]